MLLRIAIGCSLGVLTIGLASCSGSSETTPPPGPQGGSAGAAGASSGGAGGSGGIGIGGSGGAGGLGGSAGSAGTSVGGAAGNAGAAAGWATCQGPGWCVKRYEGCCGPCGPEQLSDIVAVNRDPLQQAAFDLVNCTEFNPTCPGCPVQINPNFAAFCVAKSCVALDVRTDPVSACTGDDECMIRFPDCCELCGSASAELLIAVSKSGAQEYQSQVCDPGGQACPPCVPVYPEGYGAVCGADKHCAVTKLAGPTGCPASLPGQGTSCSTPGLDCEYGEDVRITCRPHATCSSQGWQSGPAVCPPMPGPGISGCPADLSVSGKLCIGLTDTICDMSPISKGAVCACDDCGGGMCSPDPHWSCVSAPSTPGCPAVAPNTGAICTQEGLSCVYGVCGTVTSAGRMCVKGVWEDHPVACPE